jgi:hypothetical protein
VADVLHRGAGAVGKFASSASWVTADYAAPGAVAGDLLTMALMLEGSNSSPTSGMTGWSLVTPAVTFFFDGNRYHVYQRTADGTSADAPTIGFAGTRSGTVVINAFYNQDTSGFGSNFFLTSSGNASPVAPIVHAGLTAAVAGSMLVGFGASVVQKSGTLTVDNSATMDAKSPDGAGSVTRVAYTWHKAVGIGSTGDTTVTNSDSLQIPQRYAWFTGIISPAASAGDTAVAIHDMSQSQEMGAPALVQAHAVSVHAMTQSQQLGSASLSQAHVVAIDHITQLHQLQNMALVVAHVLEIQNLDQSQQIGVTTLQQAHVVAISSLSQAQQFGTVSFTPAVMVTIQNMAQGQLLDATTLVQHNIVAIHQLAQSQQLQPVTLAQGHVVTVQGLAQAQGMSSPALSTVGTLSIQDLSQAQLLDTAALQQGHMLVIDNLSQQQIVEMLLLGDPIVGVLHGRVVIASLLQSKITIH